MHRRHFLQWTLALPIALEWHLTSAAAAPLCRPRPSLVLVELAGGNDGLNTIVPYRDPVYYRLRPTLAVPTHNVVPLGARLGLHPALKELKPLWDDGDVCLVSGVGYPHPSRSHFRAIEVWETGSDALVPPDEGWLTRAFGRANKHCMAIDGVALGDADLGPLHGANSRALLMARPNVFFRLADQLGSTEADHNVASNPALAHIMKTHIGIAESARELRQRLSTSPRLGAFDTHGFSRQLETVARLIIARSPVSAYKVTLRGFDTHANQAVTHHRLLERLGRGLRALRDVLATHGHWNSTVVMTYSEFGRRVRENGSRGTDHGTAAPVLVLGGRVKGGYRGKYPSLTELDGGDLRHTTDFRQVYKSLLTEHLGLTSNEAGWPTHRALDLMRRHG